MKIEEVKFNDIFMKLNIKFSKNEPAEMIPTNAVVNFMFDEAGKLVEIEILLPDNDIELKANLKSALEKKVLKIPVIRK